MSSCLPYGLQACQQESMTAGKLACWPSYLSACLPSNEKPAIVRRMIIVMANSKGGVGKSTLAVHLAVWLHEHGKTVILADCDAQRSSSDWLREAAPEIKSVRLNGSNAILDKLPRLGREADYVIADGPGSDDEKSRSLLLRSDLAIVPCKASMLEVRALVPSNRVAQAGEGPPWRTAEGESRFEYGRHELPINPGHEGRRQIAPLVAGRYANDLAASLRRRPRAGDRRLAYGTASQGRGKRD